MATTTSSTHPADATCILVAGPYTAGINVHTGNEFSVYTVSYIDDGGCDVGDIAEVSTREAAYAYAFKLAKGTGLEVASE